MVFRFEKLKIWQQSFDYVDTAYEKADLLPSKERYNLSDQLRRASTSISLSLAEGSTGQTDKEQSGFLSISLWSLPETVACIHLINKRNYCNSRDSKKLLKKLYKEANHLAARIQSMKNSLAEKV